jgi:hypothetical protein
MQMLAEYGVIIGNTIGSLADYGSRVYHSLEAIHIFAAVAVALLMLVMFKR